MAHCSSRVYRLLDGQGLPHPELDDLFESLEAAQEAALLWCEAKGLIPQLADACVIQTVVAQQFGVEVSTLKGDWRTLRHAGLASQGVPRLQQA
jgi:hypothetical protein